MSTSVYVYYRLAGDRAPALARLRQLIGAVAESTGVQGRLLSKHQEPDLLMEVYEPVAECELFLVELERHVKALEIATLLVTGSVRKLEKFSDIA